MSDRPKAKPLVSKSRNAERRNGKAYKKPGGPRMRSTRISDVLKCNLGHGVLDRYTRPMTKDESDIYLLEHRSS